MYHRHYQYQHSCNLPVRHALKKNEKHCRVSAMLYLQEVNEAKQTKDVWVRGQSPSTAAAAASPTAAFIEGWLLAFSTKRGSMVADAPDALAAQHAFEKQVLNMFFFFSFFSRSERVDPHPPSPRPQSVSCRRSGAKSLLWLLFGGWIWTNGARARSAFFYGRLLVVSACP